MKKRRAWGFVTLTVCAVLLIWSVTQIRAVGSDLQYLVSAPTIDVDAGAQTSDVGWDNDTQSADAEPNVQAREMLVTLQTAAEDWNGIIEAYTLTGFLENATLNSDVDVTAQARLNALGPDAFTLSPKYLRIGRLFYPEELETSSRGILLDEQLALQLFRVAEPVGRTVTVSDLDYTVIGILRHTKRVGDAGDYAAYIPLASLWDEAIQLTALQVTARPVSGAGARASFKTDMENWRSGGTLIDLGKEGTGALLPLRVLLFVIGCTLFFRLLGYWNGRFRRFFGDYRQRLENEYAARLFPRMAAGTAALALGYILLALGAAALIRYIVEPVYTFPEWVPAVLVEWEDIRSAFWTVWQSTASLTELRSAALIRIRYFAMVTAWCSAVAAVTLTALWCTWRRGAQSGK